jgi:hypothetical protein
VRRYAHLTPIDLEHSSATSPTLMLSNIATLERGGVLAQLIALLTIWFLHPRERGEKPSRTRTPNEVLLM